MLGGFKLRMLAVIVIAAMVGLIMQSGNSSKKMVEPVLKYIMQTNYDVGRLVANYIPWPGKAGSSDALPVEALTVLKTPCDFLGLSAILAGIGAEQKTNRSSARVSTLR
jgi:hypothetical protein